MHTISRIFSRYR